MRKAILFILSSAMLVGGLYWISFEVLWAAPPRYKLMAGGVLAVLLGAYLLWIDFVAPMLRVKTWEDGR